MCVKNKTIVIININIRHKMKKHALCLNKSVISRTKTLLHNSPCEQRTFLDDVPNSLGREWRRVTDKGIERLPRKNSKKNLTNSPKKITNKSAHAMFSQGST
jgi:hypothetical protein